MPARSVGGAEGAPLVLVVDDAHWADIASLRLLAYLAESVPASRLLLVVCYRPHESAALTRSPRWPAPMRCASSWPGLTGAETALLIRARQHRQIAAAPTQAWAGHGQRAAEVARHWLAAAELDPATAAQASASAMAAARVADARLAPEDAAELGQQALAAAELARNVDCYPLLIGLATSLYRAGNSKMFWGPAYAKRRERLYQSLAAKSRV